MANVIYNQAGVYAWKKQLQEHAARAFDPKVGQEAVAQTERDIERLHAKIGQLTMENEFLKKTLECLETRYPQEAVAPESKPSSKPPAKRRIGDSR